MAWRLYDILKISVRTADSFTEVLHFKEEDERPQDIWEPVDYAIACMPIAISLVIMLVLVLVTS